MNTDLFSTSTSAKIRVFNALCKLVEHTPLDKLSVKRLCEEAGVGKTTFYTCFQDKYEVPLWYSTLSYEVGAMQIGRTMTWEEGHRITTEALLAKRDLLLCATKSHEYSMLSARWIEDSLIETVTKFRRIKLTRALKMQIVALAAGETALATRFFWPRHIPDLDTYVETLVAITPRDLYLLFKTPVASPDDDETLKMNRLALSVLQMQ